MPRREIDRYTLRYRCNDCKDTGYLHQDPPGNLIYCRQCNVGFKKRVEKAEFLENIAESQFLPKYKVCCKQCLRVLEIPPDEHDSIVLWTISLRDFVVDPYDDPPLVTCRNCLAAKDLENPIPRDVVSMYHNRRKLRIRKKK